MLLLPLLAHAAPSQALLKLMPSDGISGAPEGGSYTLENLGSGASPKLAFSAVGVDLMGRTTAVVMPGQKHEITLRYQGVCPAGSYDTCGTGTLTIAAVGGSYSVAITVFPPDLGVLGMMPARTWWNGTGPLPPSAPGRSWEGGVGGGFSTRGPKYAPATRLTLDAAKGPLALVVSVQDIVPAPVAAAALATVQSALLACDASRTEPHSEYGEDASLAITWGEDGVVSAIEYNGGNWDPAFEPCVARTLVGQKLETTARGSATASWTSPRTK